MYTYRPRVRAAYLADPIFKGLSLRQLEAQAHIPRTQIARLLKGEPSPDRVFKALINALGCRAKDLRAVLHVNV